MMSSLCSMPIDRRTMSRGTPAFSSSSSLSWRWVVHGGPYPATSDARGTSVGTLAIDRFLRPVCYQDYPDALLPDALKNANPLGLQRLVDGQHSREALA